MIILYMAEALQYIEGLKVEKWLGSFYNFSENAFCTLLFADI